MHVARSAGLGGKAGTFAYTAVLPHPVEPRISTGIYCPAGAVAPSLDILSSRSAPFEKCEARRCCTTSALQRTPMSKIKPAYHIMLFVKTRTHQEEDVVESLRHLGVEIRREDLGRGEHRVVRPVLRSRQPQHLMFFSATRQKNRGTELR